MKKYLDNTLNRNKKDLKKFHHKWSSTLYLVSYIFFNVDLLQEQLDSFPIIILHPKEDAPFIELLESDSRVIVLHPMEIKI
jgi:hypothetical protein